MTQAVTETTVYEPLTEEVSAKNATPLVADDLPESMTCKDCAIIGIIYGVAFAAAVFTIGCYIAAWVKDPDFMWNATHSFSDSFKFWQVALG